MTALLLLVAAGVGFVAGSIREGIRSGGSIDLALRLAPYETRDPYPFHNGSEQARRQAMRGDR